jgi:hypothetical protein
MMVTGEEHVAHHEGFVPAARESVVVGLQLAEGATGDGVRVVDNQRSFVLKGSQLGHRQGFDFSFGDGLEFAKYPKFRTLLYVP